MVRGKVAAEYPTLSSPQKRIIQPQMSLVPRFLKKKKPKPQSKNEAITILKITPFLELSAIPNSRDGREQEAGRDQQKVK